jgi:hypothetical protein
MGLERPEDDCLDPSNPEGKDGIKAYPYKRPTDVMPKRRDAL